MVNLLVLAVVSCTYSSSVKPYPMLLEGEKCSSDLLHSES